MPSETVELLFRFVEQGSADLDRAASSLDKITTGAAKGTSVVQSLEKQLDATGRAAGASGTQVEAFGSALERGISAPGATAIETLKNLLSSIGPVGGAMAALSGAAIVGFGVAVSNIKELGKAAESTVNAADRLGIPVGRIEQLQAAAEIAGVSFGALENASRILAAALEDPTGAGKKTTEELRKLGIATLETSGKQRELGAVLEDVLNRLKGIESTSERVAAASRLLGRGAAVELQPLLKGFTGLDEAVKRLGVGINPELTEKLAKSDDAFDKLGIRIKEIRKLLVEPLASPLTDFLDFITGGKLPSAASTGSRTPIGTDPLATPVTYRGAGITIADPAVDRYRAIQSGTSLGLAEQLADLKRQLGQQESIIFGTGAGQDAKNKAVDEAKALQGKIKAVEDRIKAITKEPSDLLDRLLAQYGQKGASPLEALDVRLAEQERELRKAGYGNAAVARLYGAALPERADLLGRLTNSIQGSRNANAAINLGLDRGTFIADQSGSEEAERKQLEAFGKALAESLKQAGEVQRQIYAATEESAARVLELAGREYDAAVKIRDLKLEQARNEAERNQANLEYELRVLELNQQRLERYKGLAGQFFDQGPNAFLRSQFSGLGRQLFVNSTAPIFQGIGSTLGQVGAASGLPAGLLKDTIFDPNNAQQAVPRNTQALDRLTRSVDRLSGRISGGSTAAGFSGADLIPGDFGTGISDAIRIFGSDTNGITGNSGGGGIGRIGLVQKFLQSGAGIAATGFLSGASRGLAEGNPLGAVFTRSGQSVQLPNGNATTYSTSERVGAGAAVAGTLYAGYEGVASGIRQGGGRGASNAIASAAGTAAALDPEPISKAILASVATIGSIIGGILGDPKQQFDKSQNDLLNSRRYKSPDAMTYENDFATGGDAVGYDWRGRSRVIVQRTVQVNVNALDASSIIDRSADIAKAVSQEMDAGHPVAVSVQKVVFGPSGV